MKYFVQTVIPLTECDPWPNPELAACDDLISFKDFVTLKVSGREFERVVSALRAAGVPHRIGTFAPAFLKRDDGPFKEAGEDKPSAYTVLYAPATESGNVGEEDLVKIVGVRPVE